MLDLNLKSLTMGSRLTWLINQAEPSRVQAFRIFEEIKFEHYL